MLGSVKGAKRMGGEGENKKKCSLFFFVVSVSFVLWVRGEFFFAPHFFRLTFFAQETWQKKGRRLMLIINNVVFFFLYFLKTWLY